MAIKFTDKDDDKPGKKGADAKAKGEARFATPIEATDPVNPDAGSELPFTALPKAEKKARFRKGR